MCAINSCKWFGEILDCFEWVWKCDENLLSVFVHWCANYKAAPSFVYLTSFETECKILKQHLRKLFKFWKRCLYCLTCLQRDQWVTIKSWLRKKLKKNLPILLYYLKKLTVDLLALYSLDILYTLLKKKMKVFFNLASNFIKWDLKTLKLLT